MAQLPVALGDLINQVDAVAADPGDRLVRAVELSADLGAIGEALVGHYVDVARSAGCSWARIGAALGVSKQAVQQRFVPRGSTSLPELLAGARARRYTGRVRTALERAESHAREGRRAAVEPIHILQGLLDDPESLAVRVLDALGATLGDLAAPAEGSPGTGGVLAVSPDAEKVLDLALEEALGLGHNYIGTEHVLLGLVAQGGVAAILVEAGVTVTAAREMVVRLLTSSKARRARRVARSIRGTDIIAVSIEAFADCQHAADAAMAGSPVVLDMRDADQPLQRRAVDMLSGVAYALGAGEAAIVIEDVLAITPSGRTLTGVERSAIEAAIAK